MGHPLSDAQSPTPPHQSHQTGETCGPEPSRWWALPVALTVVATGILWDPQTFSYGALKAVLLPLGALAAAFAAWVRVRQGAHWDLGGPTLAVLGLAVWAGVSLTWTPSMTAGLSDLAPGLAAVTLLASARVLLRGAGATRVLATAIAGSGLVASIVALAEHGLGRPMISGTIGNPNHLALYVAATLPALVWVAWCSPAPTPLPRRLARLLLLVSPALCAMWLSGCRSAWLAVGAGALFTLALTRPTRRARWVALGGALGLCLILGGAASLGPVPGRWRQRLGGRVYLARISVDLFTARAARGHGVGGFALRFPEHQATRLEAHPEERPLWTHARTAHCEPLQGLVELGLVGGLLMLLVTLFVLYAMVGDRGPPPPRRWVPSASLVILGVSGLAEGSLHTVALLTLATAHVAWLWEPSPEPQDVAGSSPGGTVQRAAWVAVVLAFTASALTVTATRQYVADRLVARSHLTATPAQRLSLLRRAGHLAPNPGRARFYLGLALARQGRPVAAERTLRQSARDFPNLGTSIALGNALMAQGRVREAAEAYGRAAWLHPRYAAAHHNLGLAQQRLGQRRASGESLRRARRLWPGRWLEPWRIRAIRHLVRPAGGPS